MGSGIGEKHSLSERILEPSGFPSANYGFIYIMYFIILWVDIGVETVPDFVRSSFVDRAGNSGEEKSGTRCAGLSFGFWKIHKEPLNLRDLATDSAVPEYVGKWREKHRPKGQAQEGDAGSITILIYCFRTRDRL
jgi:hypothetical protein